MRKRHDSTTMAQLMMLPQRSMNIIVRVIIGKIQDMDNNSYDRVTIVYAILAGRSVAVSLLLMFVSKIW